MTRRPPTDLVRTDEAIRRYGEAGRRWLDAMADADPLADAVVADRYASGSATGAVATALTDGIDALPDAPESLRALFALLDDEPSWVDHDAMARAADALVQHTAAFGFVLGAASLLRGAVNTVAGMPLVQSGRYVSQPAVRSVEVGEWLRRVATPGGMRRDGEGFAYTVRVRIIHAHVRRGLRLAGRWDEQRWGAPIPQPYMAFTMAEFGHIALDAMGRVGVRFTDAELADIYHLWRYVGHVVGVDDHLNPRSAEDYVRIEGLYRLTSPGPSADDIAFVDALTDDYLVPELAGALPGPDRLTRPLATTLTRGMQRVFLGDEQADQLRIPRTRLEPLMRAAEPLMAASGRVRVLALGGRKRLIRRGYRLRDVEMDRMRADYGVEHQMVDDAPDARHREPA
ncbi:oxygenase MpaB family protein [Gordonia sp. (in: high G+C Gram-positive bacteria)]|uniref:oxygenase MpaB family protein n=1 Tax=Gordonia sp. (in: high G+C Gram-positive bacteria) TaxID=84139 RepID=UPI0039E446FE